MRAGSSKLAKIDSTAEALSQPGPLKVTTERIAK